MSTSFADPSQFSKHELDETSVLAPKFDAHGLIVAIAVEASSKDVLMLAHMNAEALSLTLETGIAHYWSRSRGAIWKKGETSGEVQEVVELRTDCDQDAMVLLVRQTGRGAACHTGRKSCFYRRATVAGGSVMLEDRGLPRLFDPDSVYRS